MYVASTYAFLVKELMVIINHGEEKWSIRAEFIIDVQRNNKYLVIRLFFGGKTTERQQLEHFLRIITGRSIS